MNFLFGAQAQDLEETLISSPPGVESLRWKKYQVLLRETGLIYVMNINQKCYGLYVNDILYIY